MASSSTTTSAPMENQWNAIMGFRTRAPETMDFTDVIEEVLEHKDVLVEMKAKITQLEAHIYLPAKRISNFFFKKKINK
jgi:hypothetical protein